MRVPPKQEGRSKWGIAVAVLVIFGSSGNLATSRLIPALRGLETRGMLPRRFRVIGVDKKHSGTGDALNWFTFVRGDFSRQGTYSAVARELSRLSGDDDANVLFYLATKPQLFAEVVRRLRMQGLTRARLGWRRIVVEKPFGVDLGSARELEDCLRSAFPRDQVFRMDHFLGKEGALEMVRFGRTRRRFEGMWNSHFIDQVQITADEETGLQGRGDFYDSVGVVRDMVQSHLLQVLCLIAMEHPRSYDSESLGRAKASVLRAMRPPSATDVVWGQYRGYESVDGVEKDTRTPTFVALRLSVNNRRWRGVPFYLRTGRCMRRSATEVVVIFRRRPAKGGAQVPEYIRFCLDPQARVLLGGKASAESAKTTCGVDEYQRLILEALRGDQTHFVDAQFNELAWPLFDQVLSDWDEQSPRPRVYEPGSRGPDVSDELLADDGREWLDGRDDRQPN